MVSSVTPLTKRSLNFCMFERLSFGIKLTIPAWPMSVALRFSSSNWVMFASSRQLSAVTHVKDRSNIVNLVMLRSAVTSISDLRQARSRRSRLWQAWQMAAICDISIWLPAWLMALRSSSTSCASKSVVAVEGWLVVFSGEDTRSRESAPRMRNIFKVGTRGVSWSKYVRSNSRQ